MFLMVGLVVCENSPEDDRLRTEVMFIRVFFRVGWSDRYLILQNLGKLCHVLRFSIHEWRMVLIRHSLF